MGVKLVSASGGSVEINPPATASNFTATMPAGTGNVVVNGVNGALVSGTAQASTSGTSIDFTGIPSWVRRITVMFSGLSTNGSSDVIIQIGSGSPLTTGYLGATAFTGSGSLGYNYTNGFRIVVAAVAASVTHGVATLCLISGNSWTFGVSGGFSTTTAGINGGGSNTTLGGTLDRVRITTVNGTDTFDAGSINILYE